MLIELLLSLPHMQQIDQEDMNRILNVYDAWASEGKLSSCAS
jgi:hypothetical protein